MQGIKIRRSKRIRKFRRIRTSPLCGEYPSWVPYIITPFIIMPLVTTFFVTLMNCDLNVYSHIPYKPLQDRDYGQKNLTKQIFYVKIKVPIV